MVKILELNEIKKRLNRTDIIPLIEEGFVAYSQGKVVVPPVGEMIFEDRGEVHIKYGYIRDDDFYVIKIAQGFYENPKYGLPSSYGLNLLFNQMNGILECILLDEGYLTNVRTAAAGAIVAKYLAPKDVKMIGIYGTGVQGKMQLKFLEPIVKCRDALIWGRSQKSLDKYVEEIKPTDFTINTTLNLEEIPDTCNLIVTCTPSKVPLIWANQIRKGTHITAIGSDTPEKQELESEILKIADRVITDSKFQAETRGECYQALKKKIITKSDIIELGTMITNKDLQRKSDSEITVADLTGVAIQDIQISKAVYSTKDYQKNNNLK